MANLKKFKIFHFKGVFLRILSLDRFDNVIVRDRNLALNWVNLKVRFEIFISFKKCAYLDITKRKKWLTCLKLAQKQEESWIKLDLKKYLFILYADLALKFVVMFFVLIFSAEKLRTVSIFASILENHFRNLNLEIQDSNFNGFVQDNHSGFVKTKQRRLKVPRQLSTIKKKLSVVVHPLFRTFPLLTNPPQLQFSSAALD